jgi:hypothetical protein
MKIGKISLRVILLSVSEFRDIRCSESRTFLKEVNGIVLIFYAFHQSLKTFSTEGIQTF